MPHFLPLGYWKMDRWHCLYHCTVGSSTSLMEIRTYDPRSMEPLLYNLSYPKPNQEKKQIRFYEILFDMSHTINIIHNSLSLGIKYIHTPSVFNTNDWSSLYCCWLVYSKLPPYGPCKEWRDWIRVDQTAQLSTPPTLTVAELLREMIWQYTTLHR